MATLHPDTDYGPRRPEAIEKHADLVVLNTNIREMTRVDEFTGEVETHYLADAQMMSYAEYSSVQDLIITQQGITITEQGISLAHEASANAEQDELIALILEGGI